MKRDLNADLAICEATTSGPYNILPSIHSEYPYEVCESNFLDTIVASVIHEQDARFITEAREGWPYAIRRALEAEAALTAEEDRRCHYEILSDELARENEELRDMLTGIYAKARNDVVRWDGGQCVGTPVFQDRVYTRRLVRDLQPILYPEVDADVAS